jgi:hypothetical protein
VSDAAIESPEPQRKASSLASGIAIIVWAGLSASAMQQSATWHQFAQCFVSLAWFIFLGGMIGGSFRVLRIWNRKRAALVALAIMLPALTAAVFARAAGV